MHQYVQYEALTLAQLGACNRLHEVEERLARWLLMVQDRVCRSELNLTQEFLSSSGSAFANETSELPITPSTGTGGGLLTASRKGEAILAAPLRCCSPLSQHPTWVSIVNDLPLYATSVPRLARSPRRIWA
jgi:hypothetical protein